MPRHICVAIDPELAVDWDLMCASIHAAARGLGWDAQIVPVREQWSVAVDTDAQPVLALPPLDRTLTDLGVVQGSSSLVRYDLAARGHDPSPMTHHLSGIGLDGLPWAVRALIHAEVSPPERIAYGPGIDQFGEWRSPQGRPRAVGVLVHGGFYRSKWQAHLMDALAIDLQQRGWASFNLEYRRPDRHGWPAMLDDLAEGLSAMPHDPEIPIVTFGHSAGGQLVLQMSQWGHVPRCALAVSLAGVVDLVAAHDRAMGEDAVSQAIGGSPTELPERYAAASPCSYPSRTAQWLLVQGEMDSQDLIEMNRRLASSAALGPIPLIEAPGDHFSVIDPTHPIWLQTMQWVDRFLTTAGPSGSLH